MVRAKFIDNRITRIYRIVFFPFVRFWLMVTKHVMFRTGGYADHSTVFEGDNYVGQGSFLTASSLGKGSYVADLSYLNRLVCGRYCSIGSGVVTAVGRHPVNENVSTCPSFFSPNPPNSLRFVAAPSFDEGIVPVRLGNDVWVGNNATIIGGITVGDGAIIGAGSVVTKPCEPYGVYAGNPARLIKKRFDDDTISKLLDLKWWDRDEKWLVEHASEFADPEILLSGARGISR